MRQLTLFIALFLLVSCYLYSCAGKSSSQQATADKNKAAEQMIDTQKIKSDINSLIGSMANGKPDTNAIKKAGSDILSTAASVLSDSGIAKLYADSSDPAVNEAKKLLIKMRNNIGVTPGALDSIRKAAAQLQNGKP